MTHTQTQAQRLTIYTTESTLHNSAALYEWLTQQAFNLDMHGATAQKALLGFGQNHHLHSQHFIDLAGTLPVTVQIVDTPQAITRFLNHVAPALTKSTYTLEDLHCHTPGD